MKKIFYSILDVLYPGRCPVCHRILKDKRTSVCPECRDTFRPVRGHYCLKCGKPVKPDEEYCRECGKGTRSFDRGRGVFLYDGIMRRSLVRYKYYGCREYGDYYGEENMQIRRRRDPQVGSRCDRPRSALQKKTPDAGI